MIIRNDLFFNIYFNIFLIICEEGDDTYDTEIHAVIGISDAEMIVGGSTWYLSELGSGAYVAGITTDGEKLWEEYYGFGEDYEAAFHKISRCGNNFIGAGYKKNQNEPHALFIVFEDGGNFVKTMEFDDPIEIRLVVELTSGHVAFLDADGVRIGLLDVDGEEIEWLMESSLGESLWVTATFDGTIVSSAYSVRDEGYMDVALEKLSADGERLKWITFNLP